MSREHWGYVLWGVIFFLAAIPELLAAFSKRVPWPTLSETTGSLIERTNGWLAIFIVAGLAVLVVHLVSPNTFNPTHYLK